MNSSKHIPLTLFALVAVHTHAFAGVRHSRSLNGTGQPIPRAAPNRMPPEATPNQAPVFAPQVPQQGAPVPAPQVGPGAPPLPIQGPVPVAVPPPMPVQIPVPAGAPDPSQTPVQLQGQMPIAPPAPVGAPAPMAAPVAAPELVPAQAPAATQQQAAPQIPPIQPGFPFQANPQPLIPQGQPSLPPAPPGGGGERYMLPTYGMAGCGLGSMIFTRNTRSQQWMAAITNDAFIPQSSAITTGTSNCVDVDEEQSQAEQEIFIDVNFHALRLDASRGDGENLRAFAELVGCHKEGLFDTFAALSQGQYTYIFSDSQPQNIAERYRDALKRSRALKTRCDRLF